MRTMTTEPSRRRPARWAYLAAAGLIILSACGGDDDGGDEAQPAATQQQSTDGNGEAEDDGNGDTGTTAGTLDQLIANSDSYDEATTSSGGRVVVGIDCESQMGGTIVSVGSTGVPEGVYRGDFEPAAGGSLTLQVLTDGEGLGARQTTLDGASYTITFADIDGGIELTVRGCTT